jgi:hypothetical protein
MVFAEPFARAFVSLWFLPGNVPTETLPRAHGLPDVQAPERSYRKNL